MSERGPCAAVEEEDEYDLERIGDRATDIAEEVVFLASGRIEELNP